MRLPPRVSLGLLGLGLIVLASVLACGGDDDNKGAGPSSGSTSSSSGASSGSSGTGPDGSASSSSSSSSSGGPLAADDGLVPTTSIWRTTTEWYRAIDTAPVADTSSEMIGALQKWGLTGNFQIDFAFNVLNGQG